MTDIKTLNAAYLRAVTERDNAIFKLARLEAERDKAVEDMKTINHQDMNGIINMCKFCKYGFDKTCAKCCVDNWTNNFEWRGLEEWAGSVAVGNGS